MKVLNSYIPVIVREVTMKKKFFVIGGIIILAGAAGAGGWYYYKRIMRTHPPHPGRWLM